ncbi:DUF6726 family protein [Telmatospirillum siberiense]|uniref:Uncharacterized protein n=1 Tax=Telmatospirillum siberiense TaxID=382514 RepID=A0A2N3PWV4_9PROT|nr:DUF6726 family protein [Telmatospirillum siberiense]PKU24877.1 hypothetical protein CWS72_09435 [Telmatospirillum siberiense]
MINRFRSWRPLGALLALALAASLSGCGVAAFPIRVTSAAVKAVPVAGHAAAAPLDAAADVID